MSFIFTHYTQIQSSDLALSFRPQHSSSSSEGRAAMSHFNVKSLIFYGTAICSVVTLFTIVTAYGEANLKASRPIDGDYSFQLPLESHSN
jgi:hypothetical protein